MTTQGEENQKIQSLNLHQPYKKTKTTTLNNNAIGFRKMVRGVKTIPRTMKLPSIGAQQKQNRSKEDSQAQSELGKRRDYERKS